MHSLGSNGAAAAALAAATAPARASSKHGGTGAQGGTGAVVVHNGPRASTAGALLKTLGGSTGSGGLGLALPLVLAASFIAAGAFALLRRRSPAGG
jgi:hypothetical protein